MAPRRTTFTTRAALLGVVISALALLLALPLKTYLSQHHEITGMEQAQAEQQRRIAALQKSVDRYQDPAFIADQARQRLQLVQPGETDYIVLGGKKKAVTQPAVKEAPAVVVPGTSDDPWWTRMWASVGEAGAK